MTESKQSQSGTPSQKRLLRSSNERMLAGVAGGLAQYLRVDPTFVRLGFVAATFFGGFGLLAYLAMAVVVPNDDGSGNPVSGERPPTWALVLLGVLLVVFLPGPFWGWDHGWWGWIAPLWLIGLGAVGAAGYRLFAGRWPWRGESGAQSGTQAASAGESAAKGGGAKAKAAGPGETATAELPAGGEAPGSRILRGVLLVVLAGAAVFGALILAVASAWAVATGNGAPVAGVVIALGVALAATAFFADARRSAPWLLTFALVLGIPAGAVAATDIEFGEGVGGRDYSPATFEEIPADGYELGVGQLRIDLRDLPWADGRVLALPSDLGVGQMVIGVPSDVCVAGGADARAGHLLVRGESNAGVDPEWRRGEPAAGKAPRLVLDAELQLGEIVVTDQDPVEFENRRDGDGDEDDPAEEAEVEEACAR